MRRRRTNNQPNGIPMNCAECRGNLVAYVEGLLNDEESLRCQVHVETCASCRAEHAVISRLQRQLAARGETASEVFIVEPVMRQVRGVQAKRERETIMSRLFTRWGFGLSAAAGAAAIILIALLVSPRTQATAAEVLARGAKAVARLTSIHLSGQLRTLPADNFSQIGAGHDFHKIELWKQFEPELKWRIEKPGRVAVMDGQSTVLYIKTANMGMRLPQPSPSAFDTDWLHRIANLSTAITDELNKARAHGWKMSLTEERAADGRMKSIVTVEAKSGLPENDYLQNKFFEGSDKRRVYRFDSQTELLEAVQVYVAGQAGEVLIFEVNQIDYNQAIDPGVFHLELPANVAWAQEKLEKLPDNEKYASMTAEQAARAFFEACGREDWAEVAKFWVTPLDDRFKQYLGGIEIVNLGEAFTSKAYPGRFVPYEIKLKIGGIKKHNLALKKDRQTGRWFVDGGI